MCCWIYACHQSELVDSGSFKLLEIAGESLIIVRTCDGAIKAHVNVCRHRGSRVCSQRVGQVQNLVCPYHGWAYDLDGTLLSNREMPTGFDKSQYGLKSVAVSVVHGMVFINFDVDASPLVCLIKPLDKALDIYDLANTQVAYQEIWNVQANWKLVLENFMECYHCAPAHPEYARAHGLKLPTRLLGKLLPTLYARSESLGFYHETVGSSIESGGDMLNAIFHARNPLLEGYVTGSEDGKPLAPLLGNVTGYDGGAADIEIGLLCYGLIYPDHAVIYSFLPQERHSTDMQVTWLVRAGAKVDTDYDRKHLTWLWRVTTDADKTIILDNQHGVNSRFYEPGPYSEMEVFSHYFVEWYTAQVAAKHRISDSNG